MNPVRIELTINGMIDKIANHYTTQGAPERYFF